MSLAHIEILRLLNARHQPESLKNLHNSLYTLNFEVVMVCDRLSTKNKVLRPHELWHSR